MQPKAGFYYHYKHNSTKGVFDYAYEVLNIGHHTEIEDWNAGEMVIYRPLYESARVYRAGKHWDIRPRQMFLESVIKDGKTLPRFRKIEDKKIIQELEKQREKLYK
jgi:hypothetical protein